MGFFRKFYMMGRMGFKTSLAYRMKFLSSVVISPLTLLMLYFVWSAVFRNSSGDILGYSFRDMITYYVVVMIIGHFIYNMVGNRLQQKVTYGELTQNLLRPVPVFAQLLSEDTADRSFALIMEVIPVFLISVLIFDIKIYSMLHFLFFMVGLVLSFFINFLLGYMTGLFSFWIKKIEAIQWMMFFMVRFLSGEFIPLEFMGQTFIIFSRFLPFYYLRYGLVQVFLGKTDIYGSLVFLFFQLIWIILLFTIISVVWKIALRKFGAEGG